MLPAACPSTAWSLPSPFALPPARSGRVEGRGGAHTTSFDTHFALTVRAAAQDKRGWGASDQVVLETVALTHRLVCLRTATRTGPPSSSGGVLLRQKAAGRRVCSAVGRERRIRPERLRADGIRHGVSAVDVVTFHCHSPPWLLGPGPRTFQGTRRGEIETGSASAHRRSDSCRDPRGR